jgi:hypothetical protein
VERLAMSTDGNTLASAVRSPTPGPHAPVKRVHLSHSPDSPCVYATAQSHDNTVKLWDIAYLREEGSDAEDADEEEGDQQKTRGDDDEDEDDSDDSDDEDKPKRKQKKRRRGGKAPVAKGGKKKGGAGDSNFFKGLL